MFEGGAWAWAGVPTRWQEKDIQKDKFSQGHMAPSLAPNARSQDLSAFSSLCTNQGPHPWGPLMPLALLGWLCDPVPQPT